MKEYNRAMHMSSVLACFFIVGFKIVEISVGWKNRDGCLNEIPAFQGLRDFQVLDIEHAD